jgi:HlyD family secretion protein
MRERQKNVRESAQAYKLRTELYLAEQRANIDTARNRAEELGELLQERYEAYRDLEDQGLSSRDQLVEQRTRMVDNELEMANLSVRDQALKLQENAAREVYEEDMDLVRDLEIQLSELDLEDLTLRQSLREDELDDAAKIEEIELRIEFLQKKLQHEGSLYSEYNGTVLEVSVTPGAQVGIGQRMGRMEAEDGAAELKAAAFFTIRDGKKIQPGLKISVSPANVEKERFGGIVGYVESVTDYPVTTAAAANQIGDPEIARTLLGGQSRIGVLASLEADDTFTGFKWTSGEGPDDFLITAGTTAEVCVTVRERRPITLVFPFLERLSKR